MEELQKWVGIFGDRAELFKKMLANIDEVEESLDGEEDELRKKLGMLREEIETLRVDAVDSAESYGEILMQDFGEGEL